MSYAIICSSKTGNTKKLAQRAREVLGEKNECSTADADLVLLGTGYHLNPIFVLHITQAPDAGNSLQRFLITLTDESGATYEVESDPVEWE